ncbi:uncharacterized protein LOC119642202 isoform X4 [Glossina fuscipes]|uniref:Uncharacterized protein LOC119642202 isoform X4 n=1 Tax=Glossina fuscipes TaxID=7396 RepID=A0A9C5ZJ49_9MUSC|nr:uncharacterized protein LOC119642202 isoform X4 [Glossina fuscipes]
MANKTFYIPALIGVLFLLSSVTAQASSHVTTEAGVDDEKSRAYKLRRLCVRLPRLWTQLANTPYASAASDISSRSSSVKDAENETIDMEDVESVG